MFSLLDELIKGDGAYYHDCDFLNVRGSLFLEEMSNTTEAGDKLRDVDKDLYMARHFVRSRELQSHGTACILSPRSNIQSGASFNDIFVAFMACTVTVCNLLG